VADFLESCLSKYQNTQLDFPETLNMEQMSRDAEAFLKKAEECIAVDSSAEKETQPGDPDEKTGAEEVHVV
jgi:hypothetical protein